MTDLLTRLESGAGSDRELDALIAARFDPTDDPRYASMMNGRDYPDLYTSSLDAALSLVERMLPDAQYRIEKGMSFLWLAVNDGVDVHEGIGKPPRALCAALLRALDQEPQT